MTSNTNPFFEHWNIIIKSWPVHSHSRLLFLVVICSEIQITTCNMIVACPPGYNSETDCPHNQGLVFPEWLLIWKRGKFQPDPYGKIYFLSLDESRSVLTDKKTVFTVHIVSQTKYIYTHDVPGGMHKIQWTRDNECNWMAISYLSLPESHTNSGQARAESICDISEIETLTEPRNENKTYSFVQRHWQAFKPYQLGLHSGTWRCTRACEMPMSVVL